MAVEILIPCRSCDLCLMGNYQACRNRLGAYSGCIVLAGLKGRRPISLVTDAIIQKGATIVGAYSVDARAYLDAIRIIESGTVPLEKLHTHTFGLDDAGRAVETLAGEVPDQLAVHVSIAP